MSTFVFTPAENADPVALAKYHVGMSALAKPRCSHCSRALAKRDVEAGRCSDRSECSLVRTFRGSGVSPDLRGFRELRRYQAARGISSGPPVGAAVGPRPAVDRPPAAVDVAAEILKSKRGRPMRVVDLARAVVSSGRAAGLRGKTPEATVSAQIYTAAKAGRVFVKVNRGVVGLIPAAASTRKVGS